jgi:ankyrin repeat protein
MVHLSSRGGHGEPPLQILFASFITSESTLEESIMLSQPKRLVPLLALLLALTACSERLKTEDAALLASARTGHSGTASDMIAAGANVNVTDEHGNTALIEAARNGHDRVVQVCCEREI